MAAATPSGTPKRRGRPATSPEEREKQLQNMAYDLAEEQLRTGKASSQLMTLLIKGGGLRETLELERLRNENRLLNARIDGMQSAARLEETLEAALTAFTTYTGEPRNELED